MILLGILFRKQIIPWLLMLMIFSGIFIILASSIMLLCFGTLIVPLGN